jgi:hypothetical protein
MSCHQSSLAVRVESPTADGEVPFANTIEAEIEVAVRAAVEQGVG